MTFANVKLILAREIRDQMRDRRTLFVIVVLPLLLYPLLGMSFFQLSQFLREQTVRVLVIGADDLGDVPPLFGDDKQFSDNLFSEASRSKLLEVTFDSEEARDGGSSRLNPLEDARKKIQSNQFDIAIYFPSDFRVRLHDFRESILRQKIDYDEAKPLHRIPRDGEKESGTKAKKPVVSRKSEVPSPEIIYSTAHEKSQIASSRLSEVLRRWTELIGESTLAETGLPVIALKPFTLNRADIASNSNLRGAANWAKILPVLLLLWALTGAFYPAVDLCAGEKERGTLETLLCSPAERSEIVLGKLLTIMLFSILTAVLNLLSVAVTGWFVLSKIGNYGSPPPLALLWISLALLPVAALFSAICLALAAFARSSKEGQYYLMPVLLITMPLVVLPMSPGVQLNLGNSLIPITGIVLLLRNLLEGNYYLAMQFAPVVIGVTLAACLFSIRWAVDQFNSESVLFRESERLDMRLWLIHLFRDRKPTPTVAVALFGSVLILLLQFFMNFVMPPPSNFVGFVQMLLVPQLAVILTPALLMAVMLTSNPTQSLLLKMPNWKSAIAVPAALLLAVALHPLVGELRTWVMQLYRINDDVTKAMGFLNSILRETDVWILILLVGLTPALCEELAFRGFILSGFRHIGHKWRAIVFTAFFFGMTHGILQQSVIAFLVGLVLGYIAVQSGSIFPCMVFHFTHNSLAVLVSRITPEMCKDKPWVESFVTPLQGGGLSFPWQLTLFSSIVAGLILLWFGSLTYFKTSEERLQEAIVRGKEENPEEEDISISLASMMK